MHTNVNELFAKLWENYLTVTPSAEKIHALALHTYTPGEWYEYYAEKPPASPKCFGGSKREKTPTE